MTDRIRLDELRGRTSLHKPGNEQSWVGVREGELAALVEAVEAVCNAARTWRDRTLRCSLMSIGDTEEGRALIALLDALVVFGEEEL